VMVVVVVVMMIAGLCSATLTALIAEDVQQETHSEAGSFKKC